MVVLHFLVTLGGAVFLMMFLSGQPRAAHQLMAIHDQPAPTTFEQRCEAMLPPTQVAVTLVPGQIQYDYSRSINELIKAGGGLPGSAVLGLTESSLGTRVNYGMQTITDAETGRSCMRPQVSIEVSAGMQKVSVAREFSEGTCAFREVLQHELLHVNANETRAREVARQLEHEITQELGNQVFFGSPQSLEADLEQAVRERWVLGARQKLAAVEAQHAHIDRIEENTRVLRSCNGEVLRIVKQHGEMILADVR